MSPKKTGDPPVSPKMPKSWRPVPIQQELWDSEITPAEEEALGLIWERILMHYRNWFRIPHDAEIVETTPPCIEYNVPIPIPVDQFVTNPPSVIDIEFEKIPLRSCAWAFHGDIYRFHIGYGAGTNTLVWWPMGIRRPSMADLLWDWKPL